MKTIKQVTIIPIYLIGDNYCPHTEDMQEREMFISLRYKVALHLCLCGCKRLCVLPLDTIVDGVDLGWHLIEEKDGTISFTPSVGNFSGEHPYHAHYIITKNVANFV